VARAAWSLSWERDDSVLKSVLACVGVIAIAGVAAVALHAGYYDETSRPQSLGVSAAGLDLTSPAGVALLEQRVERAVRRVCDGDAQCRDDAWAGARPQIWAAIDAAHDRRRSWGAAPAPEPHRWAAPPPWRDWRDESDDEARAGYVTAPPPPPLPAPAALGGVLGGPLDGAIDQAFQTGAVVRWRDRGWHGVVRVSQARERWPDICRTVTIVRAAGNGWDRLREGDICLGRDGRLHNSQPD